MSILVRVDSISRYPENNVWVIPAGYSTSLASEIYILYNDTSDFLFQTIIELMLAGF